MSKIPRDPEFYHPSEHARIRKRERDMSWDKVSNTIQNGRVKNAKGENCKLFVAEYEQDENPVGVMANVDNGEIITVQYRK
jgi:hypothetical protein